MTASILPTGNGPLVQQTVAPRRCSTIGGIDGSRHARPQPSLSPSHLLTVVELHGAVKCFRPRNPEYAAWNTACSRCLRLRVLDAPSHRLLS
jgi:hypothetical protein